MPVTHKNRLRTAISNTPGGAGALTISTASSGYRTFAAGDDGLTFDVVITDGTAWEVRTDCTYTHSGTSLSRGTLEDSSTGSAITLTSAAVVTVTATAAWGQSRMGNPPVLPFGHFGPPVHYSTNPSSGAVTANRQYAALYRKMTSRQIDAVAFRVSTAGAASTVAKVAIYGITSAAAFAGPPNVELIAESNTVAVDSTGAKECTFSTPVDLPDWFYLLWVSDGAPSITLFAGTNAAWATGLDVATGVFYVGFVLSSGGLTMPADFTGFTSVAVNGGMPLCQIAEV